MQVAENEQPKFPVYSKRKKQILSLFLDSSALGITLFFSSLGSAAVINFVFLVCKWLGVQNSGYSSTSGLDPTLYYLLLCLGFVLTMFVPGILYILASRTSLNEVIPVKKVRPDLAIGLFFVGIAVALLCNAPSNILGNFLGEWFNGASISAAVQSAEEVLPLPAKVLSIVQTILIPAFFEEFMFRGVLLGRLRRYGNAFAIIMSALVFGVFHGNVSQMLFAFLVGIAFGWIRVRLGNIWITVAIHGFNNFYASFENIFGGILGDSCRYYSNLLYYCIFIMGGIALLYIGLMSRKKIIYRPLSIVNGPITLPLNMIICILSPGMVLVIAFNLLSSLGVI